MTVERWAPIPDVPDYEVSNLGRIRSWKLYRGSRGPRIMKTGVGSNPRGYVGVSIKVDGRARTLIVHCAVAYAFLGPRPEGLDVRHKDGNKLNNALSNLGYATRSQNILDTVAHGTHPMARRTHCKHNHEFTEANTVIKFARGRPYRRCLTCLAGYGQKQRSNAA